MNQDLTVGKPGAVLRLVWILCLPFAFAYFFFGRNLMEFFLKEPT